MATILSILGADVGSIVCCALPLADLLSLLAAGSGGKAAATACGQFELAAAALEEEFPPQVDVDGEPPREPNAWRQEHDPRARRSLEE